VSNIRFPSLRSSLNPPGLARHDVVGLRVDAHRQRGTGIGDQVDPQDLRCQRYGSLDLIRVCTFKIASPA
jgi:hypothetical protein